MLKKYICTIFKCCDFVLVIESTKSQNPGLLFQRLNEFFKVVYSSCCTLFVNNFFWHYMYVYVYGCSHISYLVTMI